MGVAYSIDKMSVKTPKSVNVNIKKSIQQRKRINLRMSFGGTELFDVFANGDTNGDGIKRKNDEPMQIDANVKKTKQEEEDDENELKTLMESLPQGNCSSNLCF